MSTILLLRTCEANGRSHCGFVWPLTVGAKVEAPDWSPLPVCGGGLHGLPWGRGDVWLMNHDPRAKGIVFEAEAEDVVQIDDSKAKAKTGMVRFVGTLADAAAWLDEHKSDKSQAGYLGTATAGHGGTATAGEGGTIVILRWNGKRYKSAVATIKDSDGDGDLLPGVPYCLDTDGQFIACEKGGAA